MKAIKQWNIHNLSNIFGSQKIFLEKYNSLQQYHDHHSSEKNEYNNMKFFIDNIKTNIKNNYNDDSVFHYAGEVPISKFKNKYIYNDISNHKLKRHVHESVLFSGGKYSGSQAHMHFRNDYILNQIIGTKIMYFMNIDDNIHNGFKITSPYSDYPRFLSFNKIPSQASTNHNFTINDINKNIFNIDHLDHSKYKIYKVVLNPGDSIVIPPWWFHSAITYDDFSLSITHLIARQNYSYMYYIPDLIPYDTAFNFLNVNLNKDLFKSLIFQDISNIESFLPYFIFYFSLLITFFYIASTSLLFYFIINSLFKYNFHFIFFFIINTLVYAILIDY
jgi:hypothetical protein